MNIQLKSGGRNALLQVSVMLTIAVAVLASLFVPIQQAEAVTLPDGPSIATLSVPEKCGDPFWEFMAPSRPDWAYIDADGGRTTMAFVFEPGHHQFRATCDDGTRYKFGVTGPTSSMADLDEEMRWTHRYVKTTDREEIIFHPDFIADGLPGPGYVDTVSWDEWKAAAVSNGAHISGLQLGLLDRLEARNLIGTAAIVIDDATGDVWVQVSHINS